MEQLRLAAGASASQAGAVPQQQVGNFRIAAPGGQLQRRQGLALSIAGRQVRIGALLQKQPGDLLMLVFHGKVKRRAARRVLPPVGVGAALQQQLDDFEVALAGGNM